jgi:ATP-binding cassette, subfamily F, member 3
VPILTCTNILVRFGTDIILDGVSLSIEAVDRIGLVGRNGTGKSTLLRVLAGLLKPDSGSVSSQRGVRVGYLRQDPNLDPDETLKDAAEGAFEELHRLHGQQHALYERMAGASGDELDRLLKQQAELEARVEAAGGYAVDHRIEEVLHGLGFTNDQFTLRVRDLSGGQRGRLALARLLLEEPDLLLLDEPTNHLDIEGREWLEHFLRDEYHGAVLMVSHDRYLLDAVVGRIIETEQGRLIDYPGNYAKFRELRAQRRLTMLRAFEAQQDRFRKEEAFIRRYKAGQRARQAKGRESRLERAKESTLERPMELDTFSLELPRAPRSGDIVVSARGLSKRYPTPEGKDKVLFDQLDVSVQRGERWGILGPNGAGKTTLVRCMLGELPADDGVARVGSNVVVGYYRQTHEGLPEDAPVWRYLQGVILKEAPGADMSEQRARDLAGAFLFSGPEQEKALGALSGGERSRAVIAGLLASAKNLLILDEPTNHLDIPSAERLEEALSDEGGYDGTLLLISHDRALIDATCDNLIVLDGQGGARVFQGNYSEWKEREARRRRDEESARQAREQSPPRRRAPAPEPAPRAGGGETNRAAKLKTDQLEKRIEQIEARVKAIDQDLADAATWRDAAKSRSLGDERAALLAELEPLEFEWARRAEAG